MNAPLDRDTVRALLGRSAPMETLRRKIVRLTSASAHVVITGESGTGKGLIARILHAVSANDAGRFEVVDCRILAESRTVFGQDSNPELREATGGTLFLKNIEHLPAWAQAKLARALNEKAEIWWEGAQPPVRIIASTRTDLRSLCERDQFLHDLYYTLSVVCLETVPLRDMREDIPFLLRNFLIEAAERYGRMVPAFDGGAARLLSYTWPGNVRELRNFAVRLVLEVEEEGGEPNDVSRWPSLTEQVDQFERHIIEHELQRHRGDVSAVSELLAIPKTTLYDKLHKYAIRVGAFKNGREPVQCRRTRRSSQGAAIADQNP